MPGLNWKIILRNIAEAREQLEQIEARAKDGRKPAEGELRVMLEHAYHHLNFAWNVRHVASERYAELSDAEFERWGQFPEEIGEWKVGKKKGKGGTKKV